MRIGRSAIAAVAMTAMCAGCADTGGRQAAAPGSAQAEPDITGVWEIYPDPFAGDENTFKELPVPGDGPKLKEPYASQWKARRALRDEKLKEGTPLADPSTLCIPEGMPMIMGAIFPLEFLQTKGRLTVLAEFLTQTRRIYLDEPMPPLEKLVPSYYGMSVGHWDHGTLTVTTRGVKEDVQFFEIPHSKEMTITEHIRLTAPDQIENQISIDDPKMLQEPYRFTYGYKRNDKYRIMEYYCDREDPLLKLKPDGTVEMKNADELK